MKKWKQSVITGLLALTVILTIASCAPKAAETPEEFYTNNNVTLAVPFGAGGGTDYFSRLVASYWPDATGGAMVVKNVTGGAGLVGTNYVWNAQPDGLTAGMQAAPSYFVLPELYGKPGLEFDYREFNYLGSMIRDDYFLVISIMSPFSSMDDIINSDGFRFGDIGPEEASGLSAALLISAFDLKNAKVVSGFESYQEAALSLGRGEIDGFIMDGGNAKLAFEKGWVTEHPPVVVDRIRSPWYPDTPAITELIPQFSSDEEILFNVHLSALGRYIFYTGPDIPQDRVQYMQNAFADITQMEGFVRQLKLRIPLLQDPVSAEEITRIILAAGDVSPEEVEAAKRLVELLEQ